MTAYSLQNPYISRIKYRKLLNKEGSSKKTYHIILDIKGSDITYDPGDSIAIIPENDPRIVDLTLNYMKAEPHIEIEDPKSKKKMQLIDFLTKKANITKASPKLLRLFLKKFTPEESKEYTLNHHVWDILKKFSKHKIQPQEICNSLMPMLPRLYSAASSLKVYPTEIHLIITHVTYELSGIKRNGVATEFICHLAKVLKTPIPIYVQPSHGFILTQDINTPIIMISAGCGVAPFRTFLEERTLKKADQNNWLFFGERNSKSDFYFEEFFKNLEEKNLLRLTTAFSRDQVDKIYVQDRILENGADIWQWLQRGAMMYICGDVKMTKGVDEKLQQVFIEEGNLSPEAALNYLKKLIKGKRYLKDVY